MPPYVPVRVLLPAAVALCAVAAFAQQPPAVTVVHLAPPQATAEGASPLYHDPFVIVDTWGYPKTPDTALEAMAIEADAVVVGALESIDAPSPASAGPCAAYATARLKLASVPKPLAASPPDPGATITVSLAGLVRDSDGSCRPSDGLPGLTAGQSYVVFLSRRADSNTLAAGNAWQWFQIDAASQVHSLSATGNRPEEQLHNLDQLLNDIRDAIGNY